MLNSQQPLKAFCEKVQAINTKTRWSRERAQAWAADNPWYCGFNYLPSSAVNSTEMWDASTFDETAIRRELGLARDIGFNCCRVFLPFVVWEENEGEFTSRFELFLDIASENGVRVMPVFFDDVTFTGREPHIGLQVPAIPGVHNSGWTSSPGNSRVDNRDCWPELERYMASIMTRFKDDARIFVWDLINEPNRAEKSLPFLQAVFEWARKVETSQPVTVAIWAWEFTDLVDVSLANSDVTSFHFYGSEAGTREFIEKLEARDDSGGRPIFCTEWMARPLDSRFQTVLPLLFKKCAGATMWGLVAGKIQTYFPWGSEKDGPEPEMWFHDLLRRDGTPFDQEEVDFLVDFLARHQSQ